MKELPKHQDAEKINYVVGDTVYPICPVCGADCYMVYKAQGKIVGCNECASISDAWKEKECFREWEVHE